MSTVHSSPQCLSVIIEQDSVDITGNNDQTSDEECEDETNETKSDAPEVIQEPPKPNRVIHRNRRWTPYHDNGNRYSTRICTLYMSYPSRCPSGNRCLMSHDKRDVAPGMRIVVCVKCGFAVVLDKFKRVDDFSFRCKRCKLQRDVYK
jgi:hypothetical protein